MGYAHGELQKEKAVNMMDDVWKYLEEQVVSSSACTVQTATRFSEIHGIFLGRLKLSMEQLVSSLTGF